MPDTLSPRARSRTARARAATHNPVRPVRSHRWSALRSHRVSRSGPARRPPFFMRRRVSHGWATLGSNFRDTALARVPVPGKLDVGIDMTSAVKYQDHLTIGRIVSLID